ncbi:hypothetical protein ASF51_17755 [Agreia sp. Leaf283]|nr:hypothetical protein ASF51_17755 [Agreia sp. Leaf283]
MIVERGLRLFDPSRKLSLVVVMNAENCVNNLAQLDFFHGVADMQQLLTADSLVVEETKPQKVTEP